MYERTRKALWRDCSVTNREPLDQEQRKREKILSLPFSLLRELLRRKRLGNFPVTGYSGPTHHNECDGIASGALYFDAGSAALCSDLTWFHSIELWPRVSETRLFVNVDQRLGSRERQPKTTVDSDQAFWIPIWKFNWLNAFNVDCRRRTPWRAAQSSTRGIEWDLIGATFGLGTRKDDCILPSVVEATM